MPWVRLSDDFYDHPKFDRAGVLGIALFVAGLAWCNRNLTDGFIPRKTALRLLDFEDAVEAVRNADRNAVSNGVDNDALTPAIARDTVRALVDADLWHPEEGGYRVHDYLKFQASREQVEAARESNAARQKVWRDRRKAEKEAEKSGNRNAVSNGGSNGPVTGPPNPNPKEGEVLRTSPCDPEDSEANNAVTDKPVRDDVERLCAHLAERIVANGSKKPTVGKRWRDSARLLIDKDGRTEEQVHNAIDWCQDDEFWKGNVLSMPTLRDKYDQLRLQAHRDQGRHLRAVAGDSRFRGGARSDIPTHEQWANGEVDIDL